MIDYNKDEIKESLELEDIFELLIEFGGDPYYSGEGTIVSKTICHHHREDDASHKLYYYQNSRMFQCWTACGGFDVFELVIKVKKLQENEDYDLNRAVRWVANRFGILGQNVEDKSDLEDWAVFSRYEDIEPKKIAVIDLPKYDDKILDKFNYRLKLSPWLNDGIGQEAIDNHRIGFFPGGDQITIPHYDMEGNLVGIRGRTLCKEEAERFGKYRPLVVNKILYTHPLGGNLYNLNNSKENIKRMGKAIVFESEKSCLQYATMFGSENDISVAVCGSNFTAQQMNLLLALGIQEVVIGFDRDFVKHGDDVYNEQIKKLYKINNKYKNDCLISFMFDKDDLLRPKQSPTDAGKNAVEHLYKNRIIIK